MSPTRTTVPWPELAALGALFVAVAAWSGAGRPVDPRGLSVSILAVLIALAPKRLARTGHGAQAEAISVAAALGALAVASVVAGFQPGSRVLRIAHAVATGELIGLSTVLAYAQPMRTESLRRAALPGVLVAVLGTLGHWPGAEHWFPGSRALAPVSVAIAALLHLAATRRPTAPVERARWIYPTLGVSALSLASLARSLSGSGDAALFAWALGVAALVMGLVVGHSSASAAHAGPFARRTLAASLGFLAGAVALVFAPDAPMTSMAIGLGAAAFVLPVIDRWFRPADGRLLDAVARIERALARAEALDELAAAVLDPLREAARNLRAPAAFWVLEGSRVLQVDVAGMPSVRPLSVESEKVLVTWLRTRPSVVFVDTLRPHLVRRPELRPVVDALDGYEAFAAMPLCDSDQLLGAVVIPRGDRWAPPSFEEECQLEEVRRSVEGALLRILAAERSSHRAAEALRREATQVERAIAAETELARVGALVVESTSVVALGPRSTRWIAYAPATRALQASLDALAPTDGPIALVSAPGVSLRPSAGRLHAMGPRSERGLMVLDASAVDPRAVLPTLLGDARGEGTKPGWLERAAGATLLIEHAVALGHEGLTALASALERGSARRLGDEAAYAVDVRLVLGLPRDPAECDLPTSLARRLAGRVARVPTLRERAEDLESLVYAAIDRACRCADRSPLGITPEALAALRAYPWPGEFPELEAALAHAVTAARGSRIQRDDLPPLVRASVFQVGRGDDDRARGVALDD